jgi:hypothetical protein
VQLVESAGGPDRVLQRLALTRGTRSPLLAMDRDRREKSPDKLEITKAPGTLHSLDTVERLALEMALHEESERRAMQGELEALAAAWQEAEQIAKIADEMLQPAVIGERLTALRGQVAPGASHDGEARGA